MEGGRERGIGTRDQGIGNFPVKKKTAARGSPPAATGISCNRICSLPETCVAKTFLLFKFGWRRRGLSRSRARWRRLLRRRMAVILAAALPPATLPALSLAAGVLISATVMAPAAR